MNCETAHIRVLIADDHPAMREGLRAIIDQQPDMSVVAEAGDGAEAVSACRTARPNVILMDLQMPSMDGVEAIDLIHRGDPSTPIVVLTTYSGDARVSRALAAGAMSYLLKMATGTEIVGAVRSASSGRRVFAEDVAQEIAEHVGMERLSERGAGRWDRGSLLGSLGYSCTATRVEQEPLNAPEPFRPPACPPSCQA